MPTRPAKVVKGNPADLMAYEIIEYLEQDSTPMNKAHELLTTAIAYDQSRPQDMQAHIKFQRFQRHLITTLFVLGIKRGWAESDTPGAFGDDLREDMRDRQFREAYIHEKIEILKEEL